MSGNGIHHDFLAYNYANLLQFNFLDMWTLLLDFSGTWQFCLHQQQHYPVNGLRVVRCRQILVTIRSMQLLLNTANSLLFERTIFANIREFTGCKTKTNFKNILAYVIHILACMDTKLAFLTFRFYYCILPARWHANYLSKCNEIIHCLSMHIRYMHFILKLMFCFLHLNVDRLQNWFKPSWTSSYRYRSEENDSWDCHRNKGWLS